MIQALTKIKTQFFKDQPSHILWLPIIFASGIIFYFYFPSSTYSFPLALFCSSIFLILIFKDQLPSLLLITFAVFLCGFLWTKFYTKTISYTPKIEYKFYATAIGKIDNINSFYSPILKRNAYQIVIRDVALYKAGSIANDVMIKKEKPKKVKKYKKKKIKKEKKKRKKKKKITEENIEQPANQELSEANDNIHIDNEKEKPKKRTRRKKKIAEEIVNQEQEVEQNQTATKQVKTTKKPKKRKPLKSKKDNKTVTKNYLNVAGLQEIDREFLSINYKSQNKNWSTNKYKNPPKKIILNVNTNLGGAKIGDIIQTRVVLEPFGKPYFKGGYDKGFENYFKGIGGGGYAASDLKVLKAKNENSFLTDIKILRQNIAKKILDQMDEQSASVAVALLVGAQNLIKPDVMQAMRSSGLAHLISISGLHFTLAAGILFFTIRFFLSLNQYLALHYDIKKIAAAMAIFAGFFYLLLADTPVPAVRSFIVIALIFSAILLDLKPDAFRSTAFAALIILIFSPNAIFSVSFQLSFAAILALIALADAIRKYHINSSQRPFYLKFFFYFLGIILSSIAATIVTTPFSIYHFNNFTSFGVLANLIAIPIASFITMPFGFLALFLMPIELEEFALIPMQISIHWIIDIATYVATLPHSHLTVKAISSFSFGMIIFGGLWFMIWKQSWRFWGFAPIILGIYLGVKTPIPNMLIDEERKLFAFYYNEKLIFIKPTKSKQALVWANKLGLNKFYNINDLSEEEKKNLRMNCGDNFCEFELKKERILVLKGRNKIDEICQNKHDIVVNLNRKYQVPKCNTISTSKLHQI